MQLSSDAYESFDPELVTFTSRNSFSYASDVDVFVNLSKNIFFLGRKKRGKRNFYDLMMTKKYFQETKKKSNKIREKKRFDT